MTRKNSARAAASSAKESVRHAAEAVAPYAGTAKDRASHYAHEARVRLAPVVSDAAHQAADQARNQYGAHVAPRLKQARTHVPPKVDYAAHEAAARTRRAARQAAEYTRPKVEQAVSAAGPVKDAAVDRSVAAVAALRGQVSSQEIQRLVRRHERRASAGRFVKRVAVVGAIGFAALAAWKWWDKQANPDWLVEPPAPTEVADTGSTTLTSVDGSGQALLDPEVQAKQAEAEAGEGDWSPQRPDDRA
ncbi:DUF5324 family protein [Streptomyces sp. TRM66268-LWL]|uniref:DUF5324 family protein n=1 Tax=Streptomyces polyasparticus TaxID=2767826 RepID=A0ABR7SH15_9ACTN|nr:DUF5324 family protein [Streptomyces polyasparticus]MBC9714239.1 DUF5324 family protein [Streptomyces polyasparticus]